MQEYVYEIYYTKQDDSIIYCGAMGSLEEVQAEIAQLALEFPEYDYWAERVGI